MVTQSEALEATIEALDLRPEHSAIVGYCRGLAAAIDRYPERATLWREYGPALDRLLAVGEGAESDGEARLLELVSSPVRNSETA